MTKHARAGRRAILLGGLTALLMGTVLGCDEQGPTVPEGTALFVLSVNDEEFRAVVTDPEVVAQLEARMDGGVEGVVSGELLPGDGGFNEPWSWHWDPDTVHAPDMAIEVCDGWPGFVEEELEYWLDTVGRFCPWGARVVRREQ